MTDLIQQMEKAFEKLDGLLTLDTPYEIRLHPEDFAELVRRCAPAAGHAMSPIHGLPVIVDEDAPRLPRKPIT